MSLPDFVTQAFPIWVCTVPGREVRRGQERSFHSTVPSLSKSAHLPPGRRVCIFSSSVSLHWQQISEVIHYIGLYRLSYCALYEYALTWPIFSNSEVMARYSNHIKDLDFTLTLSPWRQIMDVIHSFRFYFLLHGATTTNQYFPFFKVRARHHNTVKDKLKLQIRLKLYKKYVMNRMFETVFEICLTKVLNFSAWLYIPTSQGV